MKTSKKTYIEDVLQQEEFTAQELMEATHKHPIKHWIKFQWFMLTDTIELRIAKITGQLRRMKKKFAL